MMKHCDVYNVTGPGKDGVLLTSVAAYNTSESQLFNYADNNIVQGPSVQYMALISNNRRPRHSLKYWKTGEL